MPERRPYASDLSDLEYALIEDAVPQPKSGGRPAKYARREILNGVRLRAADGMRVAIAAARHAEVECRLLLFLDVGSATAPGNGSTTSFTETSVSPLAETANRAPRSSTASR